MMPARKRRRRREEADADPRGRRITAKMLLVVAPLVCVGGVLAYPLLVDKWDRREYIVGEHALTTALWVLIGPVGILVCFQALGLFLLAYAVWTLLRVGWSKS